MQRPTAFFAYPAEPHLVRELVISVVDQVPIRLKLWEHNDIAGLPFVDPIFDHISSTEFLVADITRLNFNVTLEIGYAIAKKKRCLLVRNSSLKDEGALIAQVGIFDTLGYEKYQNSSELAALIRDTGPIAADVKDLVSTYKHPKDISDYRASSSFLAKPLL